MSNAALNHAFLHGESRGLTRTMAALEFAKRMLATRGRISQIEVALLRRAGFSEREIAGIVSAVSSEMGDFPS